MDLAVAWFAVLVAVFSLPPPVLVERNSLLLGLLRSSIFPPIFLVKMILLVVCEMSRFNIVLSMTCSKSGWRATTNWRRNVPHWTGYSNSLKKVLNRVPSGFRSFLGFIANGHYVTNLTRINFNYFPKDLLGTSC